jgi:hypothetical protein
MLHHDCPLHRQDSFCELHHLELLLHVLIVGFASSVAIRVTMPETAHKVRISWPFLLLAEVMAVELFSSAITVPDLLMVVVRLITSI